MECSTWRFSDVKWIPLLTPGDYIYWHMGDFTQPQQKYAYTGENCNIAIPVIFYPVIKSNCSTYHLGV